MKIAPITRSFARACALAVIALAIPAQADVITKPISGVTSIHYAVPGQLIVRQGSEEKVIAHAEPHVLQKLSITQHGGTLKIDSNGNFSTNKLLVIHVTTRALHVLMATGSGDVIVDSMSGPHLSIQADGAGNVELTKVRFDKLKAELAGSGDLSLSGKGARLGISLSGSGSVAAKDFVVEDAVVNVSGAGDVTIHATGTLKAEIDGTGDIRYRGSPRVDASIDGPGSVDSL